MAYYIRTNVSMKLGQNEGYGEMMERLVPVMARFGWRLTFALQPMIGDFTKLLHIWEVDGFDDIRRGLEGCAGDPEALAILTPMPELLQTEELAIMVKTHTAHSSRATQHATLGNGGLGQAPDAGVKFIDTHRQQTEGSK